MQRKNNCFGSRKMCRYFFLFLLLRTFFISNTCDGRSSWALDYLKMREALKIKELLQEGKYERSKFMTFKVNKIVRGYKNIHLYHLSFETNRNKFLFLLEDRRRRRWGACFINDKEADTKIARQQISTFSSSEIYPMQTLENRGRF